VTIKSSDVRWIVNNLGELGVEVEGQAFFCCNGKSTEYDEAYHEDGSPILVREIGKKEFGETVWPWKWQRAGRRQERYTEELEFQPGLSDGTEDDPRYKWTPLAKRDPSKRYEILSISQASEMQAVFAYEKDGGYELIAEPIQFIAVCKVTTRFYQGTGKHRTVAGESSHNEICGVQLYPNGTFDVIDDNDYFGGICNVGDDISKCVWKLAPAILAKLNKASETPPQDEPV
jgi:hypothetical protein